MQDIKSYKTVGVDKLLKNFDILKIADILAKPVSVLYNLSVCRSVFPNACKVAKLKPIFQKGYEN